MKVIRTLEAHATNFAIIDEQIDSADVFKLDCDDVQMYIPRTYTVKKVKDIRQEIRYWYITS